MNDQWITEEQIAKATEAENPSGGQPFTSSDTSEAGTGTVKGFLGGGCTVIESFDWEAATEDERWERKEMMARVLNDALTGPLA